MTLYNIYGKLVKRNVNRYLIDWDGESKSLLQYKVKQFLKPFWKQYIVYEEFPVYGTLLKVDILNASLRIAVEINGPQHSMFHYFHNKSPSNYLESIKRDIRKKEWLAKNEFKLVEINFDAVDTLNKNFFKEKYSIVL
jgi:hypothetical protein